MQLLRAVATQQGSGQPEVGRRPSRRIVRGGRGFSMALILLCENAACSRNSGYKWADTFRANQLETTTMQWTTPTFTDMRFGFEITMYIANR